MSDDWHRRFMATVIVAAVILIVVIGITKLWIVP
jgi:hypothetical protein